MLDLQQLAGECRLTTCIREFLENREKELRHIGYIGRMSRRSIPDREAKFSFTENPVLV